MTKKAHNGLLSVGEIPIHRGGLRVFSCPLSPAPCHLLSAFCFSLSTVYCPLPLWYSCSGTTVSSCFKSASIPSTAARAPERVVK